MDDGTWCIGGKLRKTKWGICSFHITSTLMNDIISMQLKTGRQSTTCKSSFSQNLNEESNIPLFVVEDKNPSGCLATSLLNATMEILFQMTKVYCLAQRNQISGNHTLENLHGLSSLPSRDQSQSCQGTLCQTETHAPHLLTPLQTFKRSIISYSIVQCA